MKYSYLNEILKIYTVRTKSIHRKFVIKRILFVENKH